MTAFFVPYEGIARLQQVLLRDPAYELELPDMLELAYFELGTGYLEEWRQECQRRSQRLAAAPALPSVDDGWTYLDALTSRHRTVWVIETPAGAFVEFLFTGPNEETVVLSLSKADVDHLRSIFPRGTGATAEIGVGSVELGC
jgi:hypothetical protein